MWSPCARWKKGCDWVLVEPIPVGHPKARYSARHSNFWGWSPSPAMTVLNLNNASAHLGFQSCVTLRRLHRKGQLDDYRRVGPDKRAIYLETDPYGMPCLREHVQKHTACRFDSPLWQAPSWTEVANGYLDLTQWGPPPWTELQWVTLRNVIELAEDS